MCELSAVRFCVLSQLSAFLTIPECQSMFFGAACSNCRHTGFVPFEQLAQDGYGDVPYD